MDIHLFSTICWKDFPFSTESLLIYVNIRYPYTCGCINSWFCSFDVLVDLDANTTVLIIEGLYESWNQVVFTLQLCAFPKLFSYPSSFYFYMNFRIILSISLKGYLCIFYWVCLETIDQFEQNWHLNNTKSGPWT